MGRRATRAQSRGKTKHDSEFGFQKCLRVASRIRLGAVRLLVRVANTRAAWPRGTPISAWARSKARSQPWPRDGKPSWTAGAFPQHARSARTHRAHAFPGPLPHRKNPASRHVHISSLRLHPPFSSWCTTTQARQRERESRVGARKDGCAGDCRAHASVCNRRWTCLQATPAPSPPNPLPPPIFSSHLSSRTPRPC